MLFVLVYTLFCVTDVSNHPRIDNENVEEIVRCSFINLYGSTNGAAIYISSSSYSLSIEDSCFRTCVSSGRGGCIYLISKSFQIAKSDFEVCHVHTAIDEMFGNAMYVESPVMELNKTSYLLCGPSIGSSGDSAQYLKTSNVQISNMNNTECSSTGGTACFAIDGITNTAGNLAQYLNVVNGTGNDYICIYPHLITVDVYNSNFIDMVLLGAQFYSTGLLNIRNSFIWTKGDYPLVNSESAVKFYDCFGTIDSTAFSSIVLEENEVRACGLIFPPCDTNRKVRKIKIVAMLCYSILNNLK